MQTHNFAATYQEGVVTAVDAKSHKVRCKIPALDDLETAWLPYLTPSAHGNQFYCLPDVNTLVALLLDAQGEGGCVLGAIYNTQDPTPAQNASLWVKKFSNGTSIQHDLKSGDISIHASGKVVINDCFVAVNGGSVTVTGGDVIADGISLKNHHHMEQGDGAPTSPAKP